MASSKVVAAAGSSRYPFTYARFEDVVEALSEMRKLNAFGYGWGEEENLPKQNGKCVSGVLIPYQRKGADMLLDESLRTNCSCATSNAFAVAVSHATRTIQVEKKKPRVKGKKPEPPELVDVTLRLAHVGDDLMPPDFYSLWQLMDSNTDPLLAMGSARALEKYNAGSRVKGHLVRRGDVIQINWYGPGHDPYPNGHSVYCYHSRRISKDETRLLILSAQISTFGLGVNLNEHSIAALAKEAGRSKEPVSERQKKHDRFVDHPEGLPPFEDPAHVARALRHGHWYFVGGADEKGSAKPTKAGGFYRFHVARPHRPFPAFPISLGGQRSLACLRPEKKGKEGAGELVETQKAVAERYYRNTEEGPGGFFPVGATRIWHGGVHLHQESDPFVYAPFDGRVVCARFAPPDAKKWPFGSPNFVLLKHALEIEGTKREFWSLVMHLEQFPLAEPGKADPRLAFPWLRDVVLAPPADSEAAALGDSDSWKKLHLEVVDPSKNGKTAALRNKDAKQRLVPDTPLEKGDVLELDTADTHAIHFWWGVDGADTVKVKVVLPASRKGLAGTLVLSDLPEGGLMAYDAFPSKFAKRKKQLDAGEVVDFWDDGIIVGAGEPLGRVGEFGRVGWTERTIHFEIFSEEMIPCWVKQASIDDDDANLFIDRAKFTDEFFKKLDQVQEVDLKGVADSMKDAHARKGEAILTREEVVKFYHESADAKLFRDLVVRHPSEWSDAVKWDSIDTEARRTFGYLGDAKLRELRSWIVPYVWWDAKNKSKGLPSSKTVFHYHPIRFIEWIDDLREKKKSEKSSAPHPDAVKLHVSILELNYDVPPPP